MQPVNERIADSARGWVGTRFHHQGRLKKTSVHRGGVDCLGLLSGVAAELDLRDRQGRALCTLDETDYPHYPDSLRLKIKLQSVLKEIPHAGISPGDILLLNVDRNPQHLAIVSQCGDNLGIIHAYAPARAVVEHALDGWWRARIDTAFRYIF